jgi:quercetin dioxygenase-like cupin family protein
MIADAQTSQHLEESVVYPLQKLAVAAVFIAALSLASLASAEEMALLPGPDAVQWGPAPPTLPKGTKAAVLLGDPGKPGLFVLRIWAPPHSVVAPHTHNTAEMLTVISGEMYHEMGEKLDKNAGDRIKAGGFVYLPAQMAHSTWTGDEPTVVQVTGTGPFGINYINPADDPSRQQ